ncbi:MAG: hypothetical protein V3U30_00755 [Thermoplasmata archaeon]
MAGRGPWLKAVAVVIVVAINVAGLTKGRFVSGIGVRWRRGRSVADAPEAAGPAGVSAVEATSTTMRRTQAQYLAISFLSTFTSHWWRGASSWATSKQRSTNSGF